MPGFSWTQDIKNLGYTITPGKSVKIIIADRPYQIRAVPPKRAKDNLVIRYTIKYSLDSQGNNKKEHTECAYYEVTWCGDGVLDRDYGEQCDRKDPNKTGWGNGGCDTSCKPITVVPPKIP